MHVRAQPSRSGQEAQQVLCCNTSSCTGCVLSVHPTVLSNSLGSLCCLNRVPVALCSSNVYAHAACRQEEGILQGLVCRSRGLLDNTQLVTRSSTTSCCVCVATFICTLFAPFAAPVVQVYVSEEELMQWFKHIDHVLPHQRVALSELSCAEDGEPCSIKAHALACRAVVVLCCVAKGTPQ